MIVKIESYFEVTPSRRGVDLPLELIKDVLRAELESNLIIHDLKGHHESIEKVEQLTTEEAFKRLKISIQNSGKKSK